MAGESQITPVDDIAYSDQLLEEEARKLTGQDVILDATETIGTDFQTVDPSIPAILVQKTSAGGAVRVTGLGTPKEVPNVVTGPNYSGVVIVVVKSGQDCMFFGSPLVRYFRRRS